MGTVKDCVVTRTAGKRSSGDLSSPDTSPDTWRGSVASLDAVLRPVREGNTFEEAVQRILQAIKLGAVTEGERLPAERELARRLGISRVTLREALRALTDAGYVESRRGRSGGTFITYRPDDHPADEVMGPSERVDGRVRSGPHDEADHVGDVLALRQVLEPGAAQLAAERLLDHEARTNLTTRLAEVPTGGSREAHRLVDARLHLAVAEATGSASLIAAVADVQMSLGDLLATIPVLETNIDHSHHQHRQIVAAILDNDPSAARRRMRAHVDATAALLLGFLE